MSDVIAVSEESLDQLLASASPVLLDLWAPWCQPCRALAPLLETLAQQGGKALTVAKLNVEKYPQVQQRFAVRGIPVLLLFKEGVEISRQLGVKSLPQLRSWLEAEGVSFSEHAAPPPASISPWPSFYQDPSLHALLAQRLRDHAERGEIKISFNPYWGDGQGTISAALVHHEDPAVFERVSGLPAAIAFVLESLRFSAPDEVDGLFAALTPGKDFSLVPLRWVYGILSDRRLEWTPALQHAYLDGLRQRWLTLAARWLEGDIPPAAEWQPLLSLHSSPEIALRAEQELENSLLSLLAALSPPPDASDVAIWGTIKSQLRFALAQFVQIQHGWSDEERAVPSLRYQWFRQKQAQEPGQQLSDKRLAELQKEWLSQNAEFSAKEEAFYARYEALLNALEAPLKQDFLQLLEQAPRFVPATL